MCAAGAAHADPVSIITAVYAFTQGYTMMAVLAVASMAFGQLNRRKMKKAQQRARDEHNAQLQDRLVTSLTTAAPWQIIYGQAEVGGSLEAMLTSGDKDEFKHLVIVLAAHECEEIVEVKINGESLGTFDGSGYVTAGKWFKESTNVVSELIVFDGSGEGEISESGATLLSVVVPGTGPSDSYDGNPEVRYPDAELTGTTVSDGPVDASAIVTYSLASDSALVRVQVHLGADDQLADATLLAECGDEWTADDRLRGLCYIVVRLNLNEPEFQGGPPNITAVVKGKHVYDHRDDSTGWSENAALCVADFLMADYGKNATDPEMVWATVDAAANACDEVVTVNESSGPRFTCNGAFTTDQDPDDVLEQLLGAMAGWAECCGGWRVGAGVWTSPVTTLTESDNAGPVQITGGAPLDELFNGVRGQFNDPDRYGVATDFTPYQNASFVTSDERELWTDVQLPFTNHPLRATNLARIFTETARGESIVFPAKLAVARRVKVGERCLLALPALSVDATFRLVRREETPGDVVMLTLHQDVEANYDLIDELEPVPSSGTQPDLYLVPPVDGLSANSDEEHAIVTATSVLPRIYVEVTGAPQYVTDQLQVEWRASTGELWQSYTAPQGQMAGHIAEGVNEGVTYIVRARWWRPIVNAFGDWRAVAVSVTGKTTACPPFDVFTVTELDTGMRVYTFGYTTTPQPMDWRGAEIRMVAGTDPTPDWDTMTPLANDGYYTASPVESVAPATVGTYTFACRSRDSAGLSTMLVETVTFALVAPDVYVPDVTAPPTPTGVTLTAGFSHIFMEHDTPSYTDGHGHARTKVYGKVYAGGALPVFADAELIAEFTGTAHAFATTTNTNWRLWFKWESVDGVLSTTPSGGTNGHSVTTGTIGTTDLGSQVVTAAKLADEAVTLGKFDDDLTPIEIHATLPTTGNFEGRLVYLTSDNKLYRHTGSPSGSSGFTKAVDGGDITADTIVANAIQAGAITAVKLAANAIAVGTAAIQNGAIVNAMIGTAAIDSAQIASAAVQTLKIAGNAVTVPSFTNSSSNVTLSGSFQDIVTVSLATGTTPPSAVIVNALVAMQATGTDGQKEECEVAIYRDSTQLVVGEFSYHGNTTGLIPVLWGDTTALSASTTYVYKVRARRLGTPDAINPVVTGGMISAFGAKR